MIKDKPYKMKKRRGVKVEVKRPSADYLDPKVEEVITTIQGKEPGSIEEWRFATALNILKIRYVYQYNVVQPVGIAGNQRLDFLVKVPPLPVPVYIQGMYFHYGSAEKTQASKLKIADLMQRYHGVFGEPIEFPDTTITSVQAAVELIRQEPRLLA